MTDESILYFGGYAKPQPGDFIRVYRNDQCIGWINWTLQTEVGSKEFTTFIACYAFGAVGKTYAAYSLPEAKDVITQCFVEHMAQMGCTYDGPSRRPQAEDVDWVALLLAELQACKASHEVDFFKSRNKRRLLEMPKYLRTQVTGPMEDLFKRLYDKEHPVPEYAA